MPEWSVVGIQTIGVQDRYATGRFTLSIGGRFVLAALEWVSVAHALGDGLLDIRVVLGGAWLGALRLAGPRHDKHEHQPTDDHCQDKPIARFHGCRCRSRPAFPGSLVMPKTLAGRKPNLVAARREMRGDAMDRTDLVASRKQ